MMFLAEGTNSWERYGIPCGQTDGSHQLSQMFFGSFGFYHKNMQKHTNKSSFSIFYKMFMAELVWNTHPLSDQLKMNIPGAELAETCWQIPNHFSHVSSFPYWTWSAQVSVPLGCANFVWTALKPSALAMLPYITRRCPIDQMPWE